MLKQKKKTWCLRPECGQPLVIIKRSDDLMTLPHDLNHLFNQHALDDRGKMDGRPAIPGGHAMTDKTEATSMTRKNSELRMSVLVSRLAVARVRVGGYAAVDVVGGFPGGS